jgi:hypothetical protein
MDTFKKPKIGFLFTGHIRSNPLGFTNNPNFKILKSFNEFIFSEEFKNKYDYDIFISTDTIDIHRTCDFFDPTCVKNIKCTNQFNLPPFYLNNLNNYIYSESFFKELFFQQPNIHNYNYNIGVEQIIGQMYRIYDAFNMLNNYDDYNNYDFICKIRLDVEITENIIESINKMNNDNNIQMIGSWGAISCIGKPEIMKYYCESIINNMGYYDFTTSNYVFDNFFITAYEFYLECKLHPYRWKYTMDMQLMEHMLRYCSEKNLDINKTIKNGFYANYILHPPGSY